MSEASFAKILFQLTPTLTVTPISFFTAARMPSAIALPPPNSFCVSVTSSQHSSMPNASTRSV